LGFLGSGGLLTKIACFAEQPTGKLSRYLPVKEKRMQWLSIILFVLAAYLLGSLPSGYLIGRWVAAIDVRTVGSHSTGATNVARSLGLKWGLLVLIIDMAKGALPVTVALSLSNSCPRGLGRFFRPPCLVFSSLPRRKGRGHRIWHCARPRAQSSFGCPCDISGCDLALAIRLPWFSHSHSDPTSLGGGHWLPFPLRWP